MLWRPPKTWEVEENVSYLCEKLLNSEKFLLHMANHGQIFKFANQEYVLVCYSHFMQGSTG